MQCLLSMWNFQWGTSEFSMTNVDFCKGKEVDFALVEVKD